MLPCGPCQLEEGSQPTGAQHPLHTRPVQGAPLHPSLSLHQGASLPTCIYRRGRGLGRKGLPKAMQSGSRELGSRDGTIISPLSRLPSPPAPSPAQTLQEAIFLCTQSTFTKLHLE